MTIKNATRIAVALLTMLASIAFGPVSPASAAARSKVAGGTETKAMVNVPFDVDYSCIPAFEGGAVPVTVGIWDTNGGVMPPGLSLDLTDGHIKGTPTMEGTFTLPLLLCQLDGTFNEGVGIGSIKVEPYSTPMPSMEVTARNTVNCGYSINVAVPVTPDPGSVKLSINTSTATTNFQLVNFEPNVIYQLPVDFNDIRSLRGDANVLAMTGSPYTEFRCDQDLTVTLYYSYLGRPVGSIGTSFHTISNAAKSNAFVQVTPLNDAFCSVQIVLGVGSDYDDGSLELEIASADASIDFEMKDPVVGEPIVVKYKVNDPEKFLTDHPDTVSGVRSANSRIYCGEEIGVQVRYKRDGAVVSSPGVHVTPTSTPASPTVLVTPGTTSCAATLFAALRAPIMNDALDVRFTQGDKVLDTTFNGVTLADPLNYQIVFNEIWRLDNDNVHLGYVSMRDPGFDCNKPILATASGHLAPGSTFELDPVSIDVANACAPGTLSVTGRAPCTQAEPGSYAPDWGGVFQIECPKGSYSSAAGATSCTLAPVGTYVARPKATAATDCPAGFTTREAGSASENDCYQISPPVKCQPGTFSATGNAPCTDAPKGSFVSLAGATAATLCPLGSYQKGTGATGCVEAAKGYYVDKTGATKATKCKKGYGTELAGARSAFECHKQIFQTAKAIKPAKKLKVGGKIETAARTDAGNFLDATVTGPCTVTAKTVTVKVKGKKVKQPRWIIKAGSETGTCKVTYTNAGDYTYKPFKVTKTIKITKK